MITRIIYFIVLSSPVAMAQLSRLESKVSGGTLGGAECTCNCAYPGPNLCGPSNYEYCDLATNNRPVDSSGPIYRYYPTPLGTVIGRAQSDYGTLRAWANTSPVSNGVVHMDYSANAYFSDSVTLQGATAPALIRVTFQTLGSATGSAVASAQYFLGGTSLSLSTLPSGTNVTLETQVQPGQGFVIAANLHAGAGPVGPYCPGAVFGDANYYSGLAGLTVTRVEALDTNGVPLVGVSAIGASGTVYSGCPLVTLQPASTNLCLGSTAMFSVSALGPFWDPLSYQWYRDGTVLAGQTGPSLVASTAGNYYVRVSNSCGSTDSAAALLMLQTPPVIVQQPIPQTVCVGDTATFSVVVSNAVAPAYQWWSNSIAVQGATNSTLVLSNVQGLTGTTTFSVSVSDGPCTTISISAPLSVWRPPVIVSNPQSAWVCGNGAATLTIVAGNFPSYQWRSNGVPIPDATNSSVTVQPGTYDVVLFNRCSSLTSATAVVTAVLPVVLASQPTSQAICTGGSALLIAFPANSDPLAFQWRKNGANIAGATQLFYSITNASSTDAGVFSCIVSNACGSVMSSNATLSIVPCLVVSTNYVRVPEGASAGFTVRLSQPPAGMVHVTTTRISGSTNLTVTSGGSLQFLGLDWNIPKQVTLGAAVDPDSVSESALFAVAASGFSNVLVTATEIDKDAAPEICSIEQLPDGSLQIIGTGYPRSNYLIQAATDLAQPRAQWTSIITNTADTNGIFRAAIPDRLAFPQRFFRAKKP